MRTADREVPVLPWASDSRQRALAAGRPVVFADATPLAEWPIMARLKAPDDLAALLGPTVSVFEAPTPSILYYTGPVPLDQQVGPATWRPANPRRTATSAELVGSLVRGTSARGTYLYHSARTTAPATRAALGDTTPFVVTEEAAAGFRPAATVNLWAGAAGLAARVHYDTYHNFYLQVLGRKRFRLLPPDVWRNLTLFPAVHPSVRQSQLEWDALPADVRGRAREVVLAPGQILYLPSHWFHQVSSVDASVSVNVWTDALSQWREHEIAKTVIPRRGLGRPEAVGRWLVYRMMDDAARLLGLGHVAGALLEDQYVPLLAGTDAAGTDRWAWLGDDVHDFCMFTEADEAVDAELRGAVANHARGLARQFEELAPGHQRELAFGNTLQMVIHWANRGKEDVAGYVGRFLYCMDTPLE